MFERVSLKFVELFLALKREEGQGTTEYAMVIAFLVVGLTIGLAALGAGIDKFLADVAGELDKLIP